MEPLADFDSLEVAPIVHFIRHAQGFHNLSWANHQIPDPLLTPLGEQQCARLAQSFPRHSNIELIVASPLRRTLYTALYGFAPAIKEHEEAGDPIPFIALPEAQESADVPCDTGSDSELLQKEFAGKGIDFRLLRDGWNVKTGKWSPHPDALKRRARDVRQWLREREEKEIVLVTHGGFLHYLTEDWSDYNKRRGTGWANAEHRTYVFPPSSYSDPDAPLVETAASKAARIRVSRPSSKHEHLELKRSNESQGSDSSRRSDSSMSVTGRDSPKGLRKPWAKDEGGYAFMSKPRNNRDWVGAFY